MARTIQEIQEGIKTKIRTYSSLDNFLFPEDGGSQVSTFNLIIFTVAASMFVFEVIADALKRDIERTRDTAIVGSASYIRQLMFNFQFGDSLTINTTDSTADDYFVPKYDPIVPANRIVTQCAVQTTQLNSIIVKVAKGTSPNFVPLTSPELTALNDYYFGTSNTNGVGFAGVNATFISLDADKIRIEANVYYFGQFVEATTKTNVISAINTFLSTFSDDNFGGVLRVNELRQAIEATEGVSRVEFVAIDARSASQAFGAGTNVDDQGTYASVAGYIIEEDETGNTFDDTITMIEETA